MSSSISNGELIQYLNSTIAKINCFGGIFIFFFGIIGNILNILIFTQKELRSNTCIMIFLASSITGTIAILSGLLSRIFSPWNLDISERIEVICKLRGFFLLAFRSITLWLYTLATVDRWLVSSRNPNLRRLSCPKNVLRSMIVLIIILLASHSQVLYCYESKLSDTPLKCFHRDSFCRLMNDFLFIIVTILIPLTLITIFGLMTISNVRQSQHRLVPGNVSSTQKNTRARSKKTDNYLLIILFIQVILLACLTLPLAIQRLYATLTVNIEKSRLQMKIEDFIYQILMLITFLAFGIQFYVTTLGGGSVFRKALFKVQQSILKNFCQCFHFEK